MTFDDRTEKNLATLVPKAQAAARKFMAAAIQAMSPHGIDVRIISGTRTYAEQDALYKQAHDHKDNDGDGRVDEGDEFVTKAPAGFSLHNFGIAFDVGLFRGKDYLEDSPHYKKLGPLGEAIGLEWGGRWKFTDEPHYQLSTGLTLAQMRERVAKGQAVV
jgi:peptidoglycan LD-endopeptidase CwlK